MASKLAYSGLKQSKVAIPGSPYKRQNGKIGEMTFLGSKLPFWGSVLGPFKWAFWELQFPPLTRI